MHSSLPDESATGPLLDVTARFCSEEERFSVGFSLPFSIQTRRCAGFTRRTQTWQS